MSTKPTLLPAWAIGVLLAAGTVGPAFAADAAPRTPVLRQTVTPAGLMLELPAAASAPASPKPPATGTALTDQGPMRVLIEPASTATALRAAVAAPASPAKPALLAQPAPNGAQVLMLPETPPPPAPAKPQLAVVDIDPARPGTRATDSPQANTLYRSKAAVAAAAAASAGSR